MGYAGPPMSGSEDVATKLPTLQVQTVLYGTERSAIDRFIQSVWAASQLAIAEGSIASALLRIGDSSPEPLITPQDLAGAVEGGPFTDATYLYFGANLGSGGGHNRLFAQSGADLFLVMNPDTYASPRLVIELCAALSDPSVGIAEARQLPLEHPKAHDQASGDTSWASGSCMLVRSEVIATTGGFDPEYFFLYGDDVDFSWRTRLAGWRVVHCPSARVFHDKRLTPTGFVEPAESELRYSAEASVLLPWRYSRRDLAMMQLEVLEQSPDEMHRSVAADLRSRISTGRMPEEIDPDHRVGQFIGGEYAVHRFSYAEP